MSNFARAVRLALRHRMLLASSMVCAVMVAVFWGGNISVVFPFAEVAFQGRTLQDWVNKEIRESEGKIAYFSRLLDFLARYEHVEPAVLADLVREDLALIGAMSISQDPPLLQGLGPTFPALADRLRGYAELEGQVLGSQIRYDLMTAEDRRRAEETALRARRFLKPYIDRYLPHNPFQTLLVVVAFLLAGTIVKDAFLVANSLLVDRIAHATILELRNDFFRRSLRLDLACFNERGANELMSRFTADFEHLAHGLQNLFGKAVREPLKMIVCLSGAALICWRLLLLSLFIAPMAAYLMTVLSRSLKRANRRALDEIAQLYGLLAEIFQGIKMVKAFTMERYEQRKFRDVTRKYFHKQMRIAYYDALIRPVSELLGICMISMAIIFGAYLVLNQQTHLLGIRMSERPMTLPSLMLFFSLLAGVSDPARKLSEIFAWVQRASAAADRIYQAMDRKPSIQSPRPGRDLPRPHRELRFDGVSFGYTRDNLVLRDINLTIPFGESLAIVGANGCGKSTLTNLVPRFFDPTQGRILIDGIDIREVRVPDLRARIGLVAQESLLFNDTVYNNILYGSPFATREQVVQAAKRAHAHEFIVQRLDNGYDTLVGPGGGHLSGGQRQRIALARAILRDPEILILDEATSQVDVKSEQLIHGVLEGFLRGRTALIITHQMQTLFLAHRIVVLDAGRVVDVGKHTELLGRCEHYRRMYDVNLRESA